jgi:hypothetical protein
MNVIAYAIHLFYGTTIIQEYGWEVFMLQRKKMQWISLILITILLAGCNVPSAAPAATAIPTTEEAPVEDTAAPALVMATETVEEATALPGEGAVATITPTESVTPNTNPVMEGETTVTSINMRSGPTTVHGVVGTYNIGTLVTILGQTPDGDWLYVQPRDNKFGWMYADFVKLYVDLASVPVMIPTNTMVFHGKITNTSDNTGVDGVTLAVVQGTGDEVLRADVTTMANGEFDIYMPNDSTGIWRVVIVGTNCDSNIMSDACTYTGAYAPDLGFTFTLPDIPALEFTYTP